MRDDPTVLDLLARARAGEQAAWEGIVARYAPLVWAMCRRFRLSTVDAEDVGAAVWLRLVERLDTLREPAALPGWLATTTRNECLRLVQSKQRMVPIEPDERLTLLGGADAHPAMDDWLLRQERGIALRAAFAGLAQRCRELLSMLFADPPTPYAQVGASLGLAVGAIGAARQRCLEQLRKTPELAALLEPAAGEQVGRVGRW
jgi:RNA polymerase sigma factor (sigma-70 family)